MSWCPFAKKMELPEGDTQAAIVPTQFIIHSLAAPWTIEQTYAYWKNSTNLESHFGLGYDGSLGQYIGTQTRADANASANVRAISLESAANTKNTDPWTDDQINTLVRVLDWAADEHDIPRRICRSWTDPGFGYHRLYPEWSVGGTYCPGDARVDQFRKIVMPRVIAGEVEDVALTDADKKYIKDTVIAAIKAEGYNATINKDAVRSPDDAAANPTWASASYLREGYLRLQEIKALATAHGKTLDEILALLKSIDADPEGAPARLKALLEGAQIKLDIP